MSDEKDSRLPGFYKMSIVERIQKIKEHASLDEKETAMLEKGISLADADLMIENVVGLYNLPLGIAANFRINDKEYIVPMVTEESSVVAAASHAAKIARAGNGFKASSTESIMIGQIQMTGKSLKKIEEYIVKNNDKILELANKQDPVLVKHGGGAKKLETRIVADMLILHLFVDVRDAMGANAVNTMCESITPFIVEGTKANVNLRIISNYATERIASAEVEMPFDVVPEELADRIINAYRFADADVYRAVTHNKGIMNGVSAVALATGNDYRAVEAGAHAYAARKGGYKPLTVWEKSDVGLRGRIELPCAVGIVGGGTIHPSARLSLKILGVESARELSEVMAAVGLAQNFAALRALVSEGIQKGHMKLHAKNIAVMAGAKGEQVDEIAEKMVEEDNIKVDRAEELLENLKTES